MLESLCFFNLVYVRDIVRGKYYDINILENLSFSTNFMSDIHIVICKQFKIYMSES